MIAEACGNKSAATRADLAMQSQREKKTGGTTMIMARPSVISEFCC